MRTATRKPGPPPLPRRTLNPALYSAVRGCGRPLYLLAQVSGFEHGTSLSQILSAGQIIDSAQNIARIERLADLVGFDRAALFTENGGR